MNATDLIAAAAEGVSAGGLLGLDVPSPCVAVCKMEAGLCSGCLRTLDEIGAWSTLGNPGKRAVWALIAQRAQALTATATPNPPRRPA